MSKGDGREPAAAMTEPGSVGKHRRIKQWLTAKSQFGTPIELSLALAAGALVVELKLGVGGHRITGSNLFGALAIGESLAELVWFLLRQLNWVPEWAITKRIPYLRPVFLGLWLLHLNRVRKTRRATERLF